MKRLFISACAVVAIVALAAPAFALDMGAITLSGYFRTRGWWVSEPDLNDKSDPNNQTMIDGRLRVEPTWKINDNVVLKNRFEADIGLFEGPIQRANIGSGAEDRHEFDLTHLWAEIKLPFGLFKFGRQPMWWGEGIHDQGMNSPNDGLRLDMKYGPLTIFPYYMKLREDDRNKLDDQDEYGVGFLYKMEWLEAGANLKYLQGYASTDTDPQSRYFGGRDVGRKANKQQEFQLLPYIKAVFGPFIASTEWMLRFGTAWEAADGTDVDNDAFKNAKGVVRLQYNFKPFILIAEGGWAKGERVVITDKTYQNAWHEDRDVDVILWERIEGRVQNGGFLRLEGTYDHSKTLRFVAQIIGSWRDQAPSTADGVGHYMGTELGLWIVYKPVPAFEFNITGGYFFPGSYYEDLKEKGIAAPGGVTGEDQAFLLKWEFRAVF